MPIDSVKKDLCAKGRAAYFIFCQSIYNLTEIMESSQSYFIAAKDYLVNLAKDYPENWPDSGEASLEDLKQELKKRIGTLHTATLYADVAKEWTIHGGLLNRAASAGEIPPGNVLFAEHLQALLDMAENSDARLTAAALQYAMSRIPLRMATLKYREYITDAVRFMDVPVNADDTEAFKRFFNPLIFLKDKDWLDDIREPLDEIWQADCTSMEAVNVSKNIETVKTVQNKIVKALTQLSEIFDAVCSAIIVLRLKPELSEYDKTAREKQLDDVIENELKDIVYDADATKTPDDEDWKEIHELFYETALDYYGVGVRTTGREAADINAFLSDFLPFTNAEGLAPNRKRFLRQHFFAFLPYPYSLENYKKYFIDTYEALDEANRRYLAEFVLEKNGK